MSEIKKLNADLPHQKLAKQVDFKALNAKLTQLHDSIALIQQHYVLDVVM